MRDDRVDARSENTSNSTNSSAPTPSQSEGMTGEADLLINKTSQTTSAADASTETPASGSRVNSFSCPPSSPTELEAPPVTSPAPVADLIKPLPRQHVWWLALTLGLALVLVLAISIGFATGFFDSTTTLYLTLLIAGLVLIDSVVFHWWNRQKSAKFKDS